MAKKLIQVEVDLILSDRLITMEPTFTTSSAIYSFTCNLGHNWKDSFRKFKSKNHGCPYCYTNNLRLSEEEIDYTLSKLEIELIDPPYINNKKIHTFKCINGHYWKTSISGLRYHSSGCPICYKNKLQKTNLYIMFSPSLAISKIGVSVNPEKD